MRIGVIGGTGVYELTTGESTRRDQVSTPYGLVELSVSTHGRRELLFVARHGSGHAVPPHRVNYRANVDALRQRGCRCIIATNAVGSLRRGMQPGDVVLPDQFLDFTRSRAATFHDGEHGGVRHVDLTEPYCPALRAQALEVLQEQRVTVHPAATYVCTEGPRFETPAEIRMFERLGGDLVGMTGVPEVVLAREAGICYVSLCVVTNFAAGLSDQPLTEEEVTDLMSRQLPTVMSGVLRLAERLPENWQCRCRG